MLARFAVLLAVGFAALPALAQSSGSYGAIATTKSHYVMQYGTASGQAGASAAIDAAIADCEMRAGMRGVCEKHIAFKDRCAAVATGDDHTGAAEHAVSRAAAERMAVTMCQAGSARTCTVVKSFCTG
ncbi:MAG: DUF4189 domain-containing protein [Pseudomonadota bacterium]